MIPDAAIATADGPPPELCETLLHHALFYARQGFAVFPASAGNRWHGRDAKAPLTAHGYKDASTDEAQIRDWWSEFTGAMIGLPLGDAARGLVVLDLDVDKSGGPDAGTSTLDVWVNNCSGGYAALEGALTAGFEQPEPSGCVVTPSGGLHMYFRAVEVPPKASRQGADFQSTGSYVIAAPSRFDDGRAYEFVGSMAEDDLRVFFGNLDGIPRPPRWFSNPPAEFFPPKAKSRDLSPRPVATPVKPSGGESRFRSLNDEAMANLSGWVPKLGLERCEWRGGKYRAVATWRHSSSGRPLSKRKPNLSIHPSGIVDQGTGVTYTAINLVMASRDSGLDEAFAWLSEALGHGGEPVIEIVAGPSSSSEVAKREAAALAVSVAETRPNAASDVLIKPTVVATPFRLGDPSCIPRREWLYGTALIRRFVSVIVAPGGVGKSSLTIVEALAMASGRPLLGIAPVDRLRVWLWNGEDPRDELERRIAAACLHYGLKEDEVEGRLFVDSGRDTRLVVMREVRKELIVAEPIVEAVVSEIVEKRIDVFVVDPFVTTHEVTENDNGAIARVAYLWADIAARTGCAVLLVHHARKTNGGEVTAEDSRGGVALVGAARVVRVLNPMTAAEAEEHGVEPDERSSFVRVGDGKANLARRSNRGVWFRLASVALGNGSGDLDFGDEVAVATAWSPPSRSVRAALTAEQIGAVKDEVAQGEYRFDKRSPKWAGNAVSAALDLDPRERGTKRLVEDIIDRLIAEEHLRIVKGLDASRKEKDFVEVEAVAAV